MLIREKINHFLLHAVAYYILEPRFKSEKWRIREDCMNYLQPALRNLHATYENARVFFMKINRCMECPGYCCYGAYNRFSVYDHIAHSVANVDDLPEWGYTLHPLKSYAMNRIDDGKCPCLVEAQGCVIKYQFRPAICIFWICKSMEETFTREQKLFIKQLRYAIDRMHWKFAFALLFGGMQKE